MSELGATTETVEATTAGGVRIRLPAHLRALAKCEREIRVEVAPGAAVTQRAVLDAVEARFPQLRGTMRDRQTGRRRAFIRFFACERDLSHDDPDAALPAEVVAGTEVFLVVGAMAGG